MSEIREDNKREAQQEEKELHMQESLESEEKYSFLQETVKDEQVTGRGVWKSILRTAGRGLTFGLAACLAFCALQPWASKKFGRNEVTIPQDEEEREDERKLNGDAADGEMVEYPELTADDYQEMNRAIYEVAAAAERCVVEVGVVRDEAVLENIKYDDVNSVSGVIVWDNGTDILVLAPSRISKDAKSLNVTFSDNTKYEADLKKQDRNLRLAVFAVSKAQLSDSTKSQIKAAVLGNSNIVNRGDGVIVLGKQFGYSGGMGYGIVSSTRNRVAVADREFRILTTDIAASEKGSGVLFNLNGEVIGIIDQTIVDKSRLVTAYAISDIKESIESLSNGKGVPYLGIHGVEVTESISQEKGIPKGIYVKEVEADSPAMQAGIQSGDVITSVNKTDISSISEYTKKLMEFAVGEQIKIKCRRQGASGYVEVTFDVTVGSRE